MGEFMGNAKRSIDEWVTYLSERMIPVLPQTVRNLDDVRERIDKVNGREVADIVMRDPLMTVRVLSYIGPHIAKRKMKDVETVDHAVMMIGIEPFFRNFDELVSVSEVIKTTPKAMIGLLFIIRRAQRAARFAYDWAVWRRCPNVEEVYLSALLYDLSEMLMWIYAPEPSSEILERQKADSTLRSIVAQQDIFGFKFNDLQKALCEAWDLPKLLLSRFDPELNQASRFLNVSLAVDLARHSAHGWENAALPDDYAAIEKLLNINRQTLLYRLGLSKET